jgi:dihydroflavonol-4-reductase
MRILVTGSNGFIGSLLVGKLLQSGHRVRCLVRKTSNLRWLEGNEIEWTFGELLSPSSLKDAVKDIDIVFHMGGITRASSAEQYFLGNYQATVNLLEICKAHGPQNQKFVYVSSLAAGGPSKEGHPLTEASTSDPLSAYGRSKLMAEDAVKKHGRFRPITIIRPPAVYGPRDKDFLVLFKNINRGIFPVLGDGRQAVSLIYVDDLVEGLVLAGWSEKANGQMYFLSGDNEYNWLAIGRQIAMTLKKSPVTVRIPLWALEIASFASVFFAAVGAKPTLLNRDKVHEMRERAWLCCNQKAKDELAFSPRTGLEEGLALTADWYKKEAWL